jgi:hypothetical protein
LGEVCAGGEVAKHVIVGYLGGGVYHQKLGGDVTVKVV